MSEQRQVLNKTNMGITAGIPLEVSGDDIDSLKKDIQRLLDIEAIKQLKHAYFRCIDTANIDELASLLDENVLVHFIGGHYEWKLNSRQQYVDSIGQAFNQHAVGQHHGHHPEIQMLSETEATGIWYLADDMWMLNHQAYTHGTSLYWDRYVKKDGRWLIAETRYERIYEMNERLGELPQLSSHYLSVHGAKVAGKAS